MLANLTGWHAVIILVVILLVFGSTKLPALAKSVGQSMRILKDEVADGRHPAGTTTTAETSPITPSGTTGTAATGASSPVDQPRDLRAS
ncbi:twin-arginine translocase TatA/TatE family subunit [Demequina pelophila]|uniref:twin-arginine translocase TatA/TatE family subunit n=1 Tax=Demequina pelophila TaxID=1638984 RepID=UPI0009E3CE3B|nr:twin-arginine translocase TatA/TatE family subunit [Demequina pelophila]